jgi:hypothetical protein
MLGARLSGLREAERVIARLEIVDRLASEMQKLVHDSSTSATTTTTKSSTSISSTQFLPSWSSNPHINGLPPIPATPPSMPKPILVRTRMTRS